MKSARPRRFLDSEGRAFAAVQVPVYMPQWTPEMAEKKIVPLVIETARAISGLLFFRKLRARRPVMAQATQEADHGTVRPGRQKRHDPIACAFWMILSCALLAGLAAIGRYVTTSGMPPFQVVFLRVVFAFLTLLPLFVIHGRSFVKTTQWPVYGVRAVTGSIAMLTWFSRAVTDRGRRSDRDQLPGATVRNRWRGFVSRRNRAHAALGGNVDRFCRRARYSAARRGGTQPGELAGRGNRPSPWAYRPSSIKRLADGESPGQGGIYFDPVVRCRSPSSRRYSYGSGLIPTCGCG